MSTLDLIIIAVFLSGIIVAYLFFRAQVGVFEERAKKRSRTLQSSNAQMISGRIPSTAPAQR